ATLLPTLPWRLRTALLLLVLSVTLWAFAAVPSRLPAKVNPPAPLLLKVVRLAATVTGSLKVLTVAPLTLTEVALLPKTVLPAASVVRLVRAVLPPTAGPKVVVPAVLTLRLKAPLTVLARVTLPLPVDVSVVLTPSVTGSP